MRVSESSEAPEPAETAEAKKEEEPASESVADQIPARLSMVFEKSRPIQDISSVHAGSNVVEERQPQNTEEMGSNLDSRPRVVKDSAVDEEPAVQYRALYDYEASDGTEVSFHEGDVLVSCPGGEVSPGWVMVEVGGVRGWAPETYLERVEGTSEAVEQEAQEGEFVYVIFVIM